VPAAAKLDTVCHSTGWM